MLILAIHALRNATEITSPSCFPYRPSSALRQQLQCPAMRLLSHLEYERLYGASWSIYFVRISNGLFIVQEKGKGSYKS